jgi:hypothetical protein
LRSLIAKVKSESEMRLLRVSSEQFSYGHRELLLDYMGLDHKYVFEGIFQHGIWQYGISDGDQSYSDGKTPYFRLGQRLPLFVFSRSARKYLESHGTKNCFAIGAPWIYLLDRIQPNLMAKSKESYIVFPQHSIIEYEINMDEVEIQRKIDTWRKIANGAEVKVCLYWVDYLNPLWHKVARQKEIELLTAGIGRTNPPNEVFSSRLHFLTNIFNILQGSTHCIFEELGSGLFYASSMGLNVGIFGNSELSLNSNSQLRLAKLKTISTAQHSWVLKKMPQVSNRFAQPHEILPIINEMLGVVDKLSPSELRSLLPKRELSIK